MARPIEASTYLSKFVYPEENLEEISKEEKKDILLSKSKSDILKLSPLQQSGPQFNKQQALIYDPMKALKKGPLTQYYNKFKWRVNNSIKIANEELENNTFTEMVGLWRARIHQDVDFKAESLISGKTAIDRNHGSICKSCDLITAGGLSLGLLNYIYIKKFNLNRLQGKLWALFFVVYAPFKIIKLTLFSPSVEEMRTWHNYVPHSEKELLHKCKLVEDLNRTVKACTGNRPNLEVGCPSEELRYNNQRDYQYIKIPDRFKHERDYEGERAHNIRRFEMKEKTEALIEESLKGDFSADYIMDKIMRKFNNEVDDDELKRIEEQDMTSYLDELNK